MGLPEVQLMGLLTTSAPSMEGGYSNPGTPITDALSFGDQIRGSFIDLPILVVVTAMLYNMAFVAGNEERSWGFGDIMLVLVGSYGLKRVAVSSRWGI